MSDQEVFHIVEEKVYRVIGRHARGRTFPSSSSWAAERTRTRSSRSSSRSRRRSPRRSSTSCGSASSRGTRDDIFPILQYLTKRLFPFNYVVPGQSINSIFGFRSYFEKTPLRPLLSQLQAHQGQRRAGRRLHAERQPVLRRIVPDHPPRGGHARAAAQADPRPRAGRRAPRSATSSSSSASSRSSTATPRRTTSSATRRTPSTRTGRRRPSCAASSSVGSPADPTQRIFRVASCRFRRAKRQVTE